MLIPRTGRRVAPIFLLLFALLFAAASARPCGAAPPWWDAANRVEYGRFVARVDRLLHEGKVEEAVEAEGHPFYLLEGVEARARAVAVDARAAGNTPEALRLYRQYFDSFPFGSLEWREQLGGWGRAASDYLELRRVAAQGGR